ncbi:MAG: electron transfer flavoprotein subunit beta/FixA family protein [Spirochaetota bacterium]|nr:electron transfer flavoprotein subunit beta/FixA family protein [Spirochaetota bacterium]
MKELNIIVTIKQVQDASKIKIDPKTNSLIREGVPSFINPEDLNAVEAALCLREKHGARITVLTMGPSQAEEALEEVIAMGADRGILLTDRAFAGSDTLITAFAISRAIMKMKDFDLILCGRQAIDGDTAQVGPQIAGFLDLPQATYASEITLDDDHFIVKRELEDCAELIRLRYPALITVTTEINRPRYPALNNIGIACDGSRISQWSIADLQIPQSMLGLNASPTIVRDIFEPDRNKKCEFISGNETEMVNDLLDKLRELNFIQN